MGKQRIPSQYIFTCDGCGKQKSSEADSRPAYWAEVNIKRDAYDYQGSAVADGSESWLFCQKCTDQAAKFIFDLCSSQREIAR